VRVIGEGIPFDAEPAFQKGTAANTASVTSATTDLILGNNSSTRVVTIGHP